jgi:hypothetical protein
MCRERGEGKGREWSGRELDSTDDVENLVLHISIFNQIKSDQIRSNQIKKNNTNDRRNSESGKIAAILIVSHEWICVRCCCMSAECVREPCMKHTTLPPLYTVYVVHAVYAVRWRKRRGRPLSYRCPRYNPPTSTT